MFTVASAVGEMIAWPEKLCVRSNIGFIADDIEHTVIISYFRTILSF